MSSLNKSEAARRNGRLSRGPKTAEGREKSSRNSLKHGLSSEKLFVLNNENPDAFNRLAGTIRDLYKPMNDLEAELCLDIAHARWRLRRVWTIETALFDKVMDTQDAELGKQYQSFDEGTRLAHAFEALAGNSTALALATRYETRLRRAYDHAIESLRAAQALRLQNEALLNEARQKETVSRENGRQNPPEKNLQNEPTAPSAGPVKQNSQNEPTVVPLIEVPLRRRPAPEPAAAPPDTRAA
jgi:hypothetical protein